MISTLSIDISRLEKPRQRGMSLEARCPACAAVGGDNKGDHFFLNLNTGAWGCVAFSGDREHRRQIHRLVGLKGTATVNLSRDREWRQNRRRERLEAEKREELANEAAKRREAIVERSVWDPADVWESSPQRIDQPLVESDARHFLQSLFPLGATVWTGEVYQSGRNHSDRWKTVEEWMNEPRSSVGPMAAPSIWKPGSMNRVGANVHATPYVVLDFDQLDGRKPETKTEIEACHASARAITRWLVEGLCWRLAAMIETGGKSIHSWFHHPGKDAIESLRDTSNALGIDKGLIGHPEHPCRLPGMKHQKTGRRSRVIWIQNLI